MENVHSMNISNSSRRGPAIENGFVGMFFVLFTEFMFFAGLISAYVVNRTNSNLPWPPKDQPRLPIEITFANTLVLLCSAVLLGLALRALKTKEPSKEKGSGSRTVTLFVVLSFILGAVFLSIQGREWLKLLEYGATGRSHLFFGFFYVIVGAHGLHVLVGLVILGFALMKLLSVDNSSANFLRYGSLYWFFVVTLWPFLYYLVYVM